MSDDGRTTPDCPCCAAGGCPSCDAGHHAGERSHDFTGPGHSITRPTPDRAATAQVTTDEHGNYVVKMGTHLLHHTYGQTWEARRDATLVCQGANRALDRIRMAT